MNKDVVLVLTVGGSNDPLIKILKEKDPGYIYFIPSQKSKNKIPDILKAVYPKGCHAVQKNMVIDDPNDMKDCYKHCHDAFKDIRQMGIDDKTVVADPTGGTKIMSAALVLAAADIGITISYVSGTRRTKDGLGVVENGTEEVVYSSHPFDIISKSQKEMFCQYFNSYRFEAAIDISEEIIRKGSESLKSIFKTLVSITKGYRDWDLFNYKNCAHQLEGGIYSFHKLSAEYPEESRELYKFIKDVSDNLNYLKGVKPNEINMNMVEELVANALRRAEEGKYDDAVARLYRALEMLAQYRFIKVFKHNTTEFPINILSAEIRKELNLGEKSERDIACYEAYQILYMMNDRYGILYFENEDEIKKILDLRNKSILAHGIYPLNAEKFDKLYSIFSEVFEIDGKSIKFPKIDPEALMQIELV